MVCGVGGGWGWGLGDHDQMISIKKPKSFTEKKKFKINSNKKVDKETRLA